MWKPIVGIALACSFMAGVVHATPLWQVKGGQTSIKFEESFAGSIGECDVERIKQGVFKPNDAKVRFRILGGALNTENVTGEVFHSGGFTLTCPAMADGPTLALQSFILDLQPETPVITGLVTLEGGTDPVFRGRLPLFKVGVDQLEIEVAAKGQWMKFRNAELFPTADLVGQLMEVTLSADEEVSVGKAWGKVQLRRPEMRKGKDKDDEEKEEYEKGEDEDDDEEDDD